MAIETHVHDGSAWRKAKQIYVHDGTAWRDLKEAWCHDGTTWRKVFQKGQWVTLGTTGATTIIDVTAQGGDPVLLDGGTATAADRVKKWDGSAWNGVGSCPSSPQGIAVNSAGGLFSLCGSTLYEWTGATWSSHGAVGANKIAGRPAATSQILFAGNSSYGFWDGSSLTYLTPPTPATSIRAFKVTPTDTYIIGTVSGVVSAYRWSGPATGWAIHGTPSLTVGDVSICETGPASYQNYIQDDQVYSTVEGGSYTALGGPDSDSTHSLATANGSLYAAGDDGQVYKLSGSTWSTVGDPFASGFGFGLFYDPFGDVLYSFSDTEVRWWDGPL